MPAGPGKPHKGVNDGWIQPGKGSIVEAKNGVYVMPVGMTFLLKALGDAPQAPLAGEWFRRFLGRMASQAGISEEVLVTRPAPFTISSLMPADGSRPAGAAHPEQGQPTTEVRSGDRFRLRFTWLADSSLKALLDWVQSLREQPVRVETGRGPLLVEGALVSPALAQRWNRWVSYEQLHTEASDSLRFVTLKFCSPTALQRSGLPYPLPDPCGIFLGYSEIWNTFSGIPLARGLWQAIEERLVLIDFRLRRSPLSDRKDSLPGFIGSATFRLDGRHPESVIKGLNVMADFAFFCGTGIGTDRGMGLTRRILKY
jgi:CRISPR-associated endoribonuclease Cas6